jgi:hypothetical protein
VKYLSENEVGFDTTDLGFPSVSGCHAVVYVMSMGLFGLHNFGGAERDVWPGRSAVFANFVQNHDHYQGAGKLLYGVCYATGGNSRGYGDTLPKKVWTEELVAFAQALGYRGDIYGYDLASRNSPPPAYVDFRKVDTTCVIQTAPWNNNSGTRGANQWPLNHRMFRRVTGTNDYALQDVNTVVTSVATSPPTTVYPEKLAKV